MPGNKYLSINGSGDILEVASTNSSSGAGDANKIVSLNAFGQIDATMLPDNGSFTMTASEDLSAGALINVWNSSGAKVRNADSSVPIQAVGFVENAITNGNSGTVVLGNGVNSGVTSLSIGTQYFLGTVGAVTSTAPTTAGHILQRVGLAKSATELVVILGDPIIRA